MSRSRTLRAASALAQRAERVHDRNVDVVVGARGLDRLLGERGHFLVLAGGEERPQQEVIRPFAVALARDRGAGQPHGVVVPAAGVEDPGLGDEDLGDVGRERHGPQRRRLGAFHVRRPRPDQYWAWAQPLAIAAQASAKLGSSATAFSNIWRANSMSWRRAPAGVAAAPQVEVVGLEVLGRLGGELRLLLRRELDAQRLGDLVRDLVLHLEDVGHLAVVALRPDREAGRRVHELGVDPQPVPGAAQAPLERIAAPELPADVRRGRPSGRGKASTVGAREDVQALDLREVGQDVLGDAVPQVLVFLHPERFSK